MKKIMPKLHTSGWKRRISRVLIFTMLFSTFMHQGWYKPKPAQAVTIGTTTTMVRPTGGTGAAGPLTITNASWSCGAGTNRLLVIAVTGEAGASQVFSVTATKGAGINFTTAVNTSASRDAAYIGYLTEAQITASGTNSIVITAPGTEAGFDASVACYSNVDQNNPIVATTLIEGETAALTTGNFSVSALNQGMVVFAVANANVQAITMTYTGATKRVDLANGAVYETCAGDKPITANGTESGSFSWTTSTRFGVAVASLRPYPDFTVGDGTTVGSMSVGPSSTNNTLDSFTMIMNSGTGTVTSLVVTGSTNFTATNIPTNGVIVWRDTGTTVGQWDSGDTQVSTASSAIAGNATTVAINNESVTTTAKNYIVTVNINAGATLAQSFTGTITSAAGTGLGTTLAYNDTSSATLTIATPNLAIANGTNPVDKKAQPNSTNNALDGFTMGTTATSPNSTVTSLTVAGSANFTSTNIPTNGVKVWRDTGTTVGWWDAGDTLISSASTAISGNATTVTISSEAVTYPLKNYLVTVDINSGATLGQSFTATVTAASGANLGTPTYADSSSATLTVNKLDSSSTSCGSCHAYPPYDGTTRDPVSGAVVGDHQVGGHKVVCSTCHVAPATETSVDFAHRTGNIQMQTVVSGGSYTRGTSFPQTNTLSTTGCSNISCHGGNNPTPQWGVGTVGCIDCHNGIVAAPTASIVSGGTVTQRDNVISEFGLAWGHKKSGRGAVTNADCIVCHLEGSYSTQKTSAKHGDGYIDLRDPDGAGETAITNMSGGIFTFVTFSTSYAAGSRTSTGQTSNNVDNVLTQKFCIKCHDSNGAQNPGARVPTGTQYVPFGTPIAGAGYVPPFSAGVAGGVVDVDRSFATTNSSVHPLKGPRNKDLPTSAILNVPYDYQVAGRVAAGGVKTDSVVLNCFDCHNSPTLVTTRTVAAHGASATNYLRGTIYVSSPTLCLACHASTYATTAYHHPSGSAFFADGDTSRHTVTYQAACHNCHASQTAKPARPQPAEDYHGFDRLAGTGADALWPVGATETNKPYAFMRQRTNWNVTGYGPRPLRGIGGQAPTAGSASCATAAGGIGGTGSCDTSGRSMLTYTPGGTY